MLQGLAAAIGAVMITFSADHSLSFGAGAIALTAVTSVVGLVFVSRGLVAFRWAFVASASMIAVNVVAAGFFIWIAAAASPDSASLYPLVVGAWSGLIAVASAGIGWVLTDGTVARDFFVMAGFAGILAVVEVAVPLSDIYAVGIVGAYCAVLAVYVTIAGLSLRFPGRHHAVAAQPKEKR